MSLHTTLGFLLMILSITCIAQKSIVSQKHYFKNFLIETGLCKDGADIKIFKDNKIIYKKCFADVFRFGHIDKIDINGDGISDFIYSLQMDDYSIIGILVSNSKAPSYESFDITDVSSAELYGNLTLAKGGELKGFLVIDNNKDGEKELVTNVILKNNKVVFIKDFSKTVSLKDIKKRIKMQEH